MYYVNQQVRQDYPVPYIRPQIRTYPHQTIIANYYQTVPELKNRNAAACSTEASDSCPFRLPEYKIDIAFSKSLDRICGLDAIKSSPVKSGLGVGYLET